MDFKIPQPMKLEHNELHSQLAKATKEPGRIGEAARGVAKVLHNHFVNEEAYAIPPLGLLPQLAAGKVTKEMADVLKMTDKLKVELPTMLKEHEAIVSALDDLVKVAKSEGREEYIHFADKLKLHAQTEEEVTYPTAILIGEYLRLKLIKNS
jgi:hypothetical protein